MLDLDHVRTFVAIVDEGGFRRAARARYLSQPGISHHVHRLESELGVSLFVRGRDGCRLTPEGLRFLPFARVMLVTEQAALTANRGAIADSA